MLRREEKSHKKIISWKVEYWNVQLKKLSDCSIKMGGSWPDWRQEGRRLSHKSNPEMKRITHEGKKRKILGKYK